MELQLDAAPTGTRADLARRLGISKAAISQGIKAGRLSRAAFIDDKRLDLERAAREWLESRERERVDTDAPAAPATTAPSGGSNVLRSAKERTEQLRAEKLELELRQAKDELRPRAEVERSMVTAGRELRHVIEAEIRSWADELVSLTGAERQRLVGFLRRKANELNAAASKRLALMGAGEDQGGSDGHAEAA